MDINEDIADWFTSREEKFSAILAFMVSSCKEKCGNLGIKLATAPEFRLKEENEIRKKITRKKYTDVKCLTDYAGCRLLFKKQEDANLFFDDLNSDSEFEVDKDNTIDKRLLYDPDRFGYISHHVVLSFVEFPQLLRESYPDISFDDSPQNYKIEIQMRTLIQHAWAIISRQLIYDKIENVPFKLRKRFYRLVAMLESIDSEIDSLFVDYFSNRKILEEEYFLKQNINQNNLKKYLELQVESNILITEKLADWIFDLKAVGINTISDFHNLLIDFYDNFYTIYKGKLSELIINSDVSVSVDDFCGFPGWMIDAIIWHNPEKYSVYFKAKGKTPKRRSDQFSHPEITEQYMKWLNEIDFGRSSFLSK